MASEAERGEVSFLHTTTEAQKHLFPNTELTSPSAFLILLASDAACGELGLRSPPPGAPPAPPGVPPALPCDACEPGLLVPPPPPPGAEDEEPLAPGDKDVRWKRKKRNRENSLIRSSQQISRPISFPFPLLPIRVFFPRLPINSYHPPFPTKRREKGARFRGSFFTCFRRRVTRHHHVGD